MPLAEATTRRLQIAAPLQNAIPADLKPQAATKQLAQSGKPTEPQAPEAPRTRNPTGASNSPIIPLDKFKQGQNCGKPRRSLSRTGGAP
jgi:hypothetical protein